MARNELVTAAETLKQARGSVSDSAVGDRMDAQAAQLEKLADADRGPDHGRLDKIMYTLSEIKEAVDEETAEQVQSAYDHVKAYRETVEGI